jgi:hypothetical protein
MGQPDKPMNDIEKTIRSPAEILDSPEHPCYYSNTCSSWETIPRMTTTADQFLLAYQAYQEIQAELPGHEQARAGSTPAAFDLAAIPPGSLLLGLAEDGLPVLLDLHDPSPGPLLVAADGGCGKTALLKSLARAADLQDPGDTQVGVLTPFPEEWRDLEALPGCLGVWPTYHPASQDFMRRLISWAEALGETRQIILLLVDGLDLFTAGPAALRGALRWLMSHGPSRQVWPVVSANPGRLARLPHWLDYFQTRLLGQVKRPEVARLVSGGRELNLGDLLPGKQFGLLRSDGWLRFWLPSLDQEACR